MRLINTIIGWAMKTKEGYRIYNPTSRKLFTMSENEFKSMNVGDFPYFVENYKFYENGDVVEYKDTIYVVQTGKFVGIETEKKLLEPQNRYEVYLYIPIHQKYFTYADIKRKKQGIDKRTKEMLKLAKENTYYDGYWDEEVCDKLMNLFQHEEYKGYLNERWY